MGNNIIKNSRNFIVRVYVDNYNKGLCVLHIIYFPIAAWNELGLIMFNHIIIIFQSDSASGDDFNVVGSSLLAILDDYAFNHNIEGDIHFLLENIGNTIICKQHTFTSSYSSPVKEVDNDNKQCWS